MLRKISCHGFKTSLTASVLLSAVLLVGCAEEGGAEKVGRQIDETIEKIKHGDEGPLEKAGRKTDEALAELKESLEKDTEKEN